MKVTKTRLRLKLRLLNRLNGSEYELDYLTKHGYVITNHEGTVHLTGRLTAKSMYHYLNGAIDFIDRNIYKVRV